MCDMKYMLERIPLIACPSEQLEVMQLPSFDVVPTQRKHYIIAANSLPHKRGSVQDMERRWSVQINYNKAANEFAKSICISIFNRQISSINVSFNQR